MTTRTMPYKLTSGFVKNNPELFPEVFELVGVPQPEKWHPEGDAFIHTMMVLDMANELYENSPLVVYGALTHDLGKAHTQKFWPSHHGHASLGIAPTETLLRRLGVDSQFIDECKFLTKFHMHVHDAFKMKASTYVRIYQEAKIVSPNNWTMLLVDLTQLGRCDHYGRGGINRSEHYYNPVAMNMMFTEIALADAQREGTDEIHMDGALIKSLQRELDAIKKEYAS